MRVWMDGRKWPDRPHWQFAMERLGEDEHGIWHRVRAGTRAQRGAEEPITLEHAFVQLIPAGTWWIAEFYANHPRWQLYVNIGTPCEWSAGRVRQVDLDLDVVRTLDGRIEVLDEGEFADHRVRLGYPSTITDGARRAVMEVTELLSRGAEPFGSAVRPWLEMIR